MGFFDFILYTLIKITRMIYMLLMFSVCILLSLYHFHFPIFFVDYVYCEKYKLNFDVSMYLLYVYFAINF